ncbi:beta-1,3-N-acetylglucosaminyltransferase lunatic fringe-like [Dysidea avara]|uniref:beta-1,3-N-acetylglucosaminyltransferase lunatic fringe-like n=1 Tax=Dysidea avara TaxID=196820 RepID=UPI0033285979
MIKSSTIKLKRVALLGVSITILLFGLLHYGRSGEFFRSSTRKNSLGLQGLDRHITPASHPLIFGKTLQPVKRYLPEDVYISLRTTQVYHTSRLSLLLLTWLQALPADQLHIVTDGLQNNSVVKMLTSEGYNVTVSSCPQNHKRASLCCKTGVEFSLYYRVMENYSWFCHLDDDMYLNTKVLAKYLANHNHNLSWYIGYYPLAAGKPFELDSYRLKSIKNPKRTKFSFATGGTYCISRPLLRKLINFFNGNNFEATCNQFMLTDDMIIGMVIEVILGFNLTDVSNIKTHLQSLSNIKPADLVNLISVSYGGKNNRIKLPQEIKNDTSGFLSYHCLLYPEVKWCSQPNAASTR